MQKHVAELLEYPHFPGETEVKRARVKNSNTLCAAFMNVGVCVLVWTFVWESVFV